MNNDMRKIDNGESVIQSNDDVSVSDVVQFQGVEQVLAELEERKLVLDKREADITKKEQEAEKPQKQGVKKHGT